MITPGEINTKHFEKSSFGGYRQEDVDNYLTLLAGEFAKLQDENAELENKILVLVDKIEEYKEDEDSLKSAIVGAQKLSDSMIKEAKTKSEIIIRDAGKKAEKVVEDAKYKIDKEKLALSKMQKEVAAFKTKILNLYKQHLETISDIPDADEKEYDFEDNLNEAFASDNKENDAAQVVEVLDVSENINESEAAQEDSENEADFEEQVTLDGFKIEKDDESSEQEPEKTKRESRFGELKFGADYEIKQDEEHSRFGKKKK